VVVADGAVGGRREEERRYGFSSMADVLVYSYEVGIEKPDPRIYEITCQRLGVRPSEMQVVLFQSTTEAITEVEACLADPGG